MDMNDATRIIGVIDSRIARKTGNGATVETTWGEVCGVSSNGKFASAYLYGDTDNPSEDFRLPSDLAVSVGDHVKVAWDARGERWIYDVIVSSAYPKLKINPNTGELLAGDGTVEPVVVPLGNPTAADVAVEDTDGNFTATDVEGALAESMDAAQAAQVDADAALAHVTDATDAHDASAVSIADAGSYFSDAHVEGALQALGLATKFKGTRVYRNAGQSIAASTSTAILFTHERFDTDAFHSTSSNTSRITIPSGMGGKYLIGAHIQWAASTSGYRSLILRVNGSTFIARQDVNALSTSAALAQTAVTVYDLAAGDYIEAVVFANTALDINATADYSPEFWVVKVG